MSKFTLKPLLAAFLCMVFIGTNVYAGESPVSKKASQVTEWKFKTEKPVVATPVIAGDVIYVGSEDGHFYALAADSGELRWKYETGHRITSTAAINKNTVVFESGNVLYALDMKGKPKWTFTLAEPDAQDRIDPWDFHHASPDIHKGVVYIGTIDGMVYGVKLKTGEQVFKCATGGSAVIRTTPAVLNGNVLFGDWEGMFYSCNLKSGKISWRYDTRQDANYSWKNSIHGTASTRKNLVYFAGRSSRLYCLDAGTGEKKWMHVSPTEQWLVGGPRIDGNVVFIGSSDQHLFQSFDADTGKQLWQFSADGRIWGVPYVDAGHVYFAARSLYALDRFTGGPLQKVEFEQVHPDQQYDTYVDQLANMHSAPLLYKDRIIVGSDDGHIYALHQQ